MTAGITTDIRTFKAIEVFGSKNDMLLFQKSKTILRFSANNINVIQKDLAKIKDFAVAFYFYVRRDSSLAGIR